MISIFLERERAGGWLALGETDAVLATHGITIAASDRCRALEQAIDVAAELGAPVVLGADLPAPARTSEIDAVLLGLKGASAIRSA